MKLLVIGGSVFVGRAFAAEGLRRGWEVTVFNRGRTQADLPGVRALRGDRTDEADLAAAGPYDAVVDVCGYVPREVAKSATALAAHADAYLFVSTINVFSHFPAQPTDESSPRHGGTADAGPRGRRLRLAQGRVREGSAPRLPRKGRGPPTRPDRRTARPRPAHHGLAPPRGTRRPDGRPRYPG
ncbi:NAD-dependent epimerase/dehydratase family protein, partial [Streptomyces sp. NPDC004166]